MASTGNSAHARTMSEILHDADSDTREVQHQIIPRDMELEKAEKAVQAGMAEFHNVARQRNDWMQRYEEERMRGRELEHALAQEKEAGKLHVAKVTQELIAEGHRREAERQVLDEDRERLNARVNELESQLITAQARISKLEAGITMVAGNLADMLPRSTDDGGDHAR